MNGHSDLPNIGSLHGVFAQGHIQPETVTIFEGWTRLTTDNHGEMDGDPLQGFFCAETRLITLYKLTLNGRALLHRLSAQLSPNEWSTIGTVLHSGDSGNLPSGKIPKGAIEVRILRKCGKGLSELIFIKNNGVIPQKIDFQLRLATPITDSEFNEENKNDKKAPIRGVRPRVYRRGQDFLLHFGRTFGKRRKTPSAELDRIYGTDAPQDGTTVKRGLEIKVSQKSQNENSKTQVKGGRQSLIRVRALLGPREELCLQLAYEPLIDAMRMPAPEIDGLPLFPRKTSPADSLSIRSNNPTFDLLVGQAQSDFRSLRLPVFGASDLDRVLDRVNDKYTSIIAGVPRYIGLFGRDTVISAWQAILFDSDYLDPALSRLELFQGIKTDSWRDEEPDRMLHERRLDPQAEVGKLNRNLYYGDVTSTPFWVLALCDLYRWTGDKEFIRRHREGLIKCCRWILRRLHEGDGFIYYAPAKPRFGDENRNQGWKDSGDAIVDENGRVRTPPLALAEIQGYAYQALVEGADLLKTLDASIDVTDLRIAGRNLKTLFNTKFWLPEERFYALGLDGKQNALRSRASNIGHCLTTEIIEDEHIQAVVQGLMAEDMFSGWGIRTLSSQNRAYDPFSYHRGSVWPVENAIIADGMAMKGFRAEANAIIAGQLSLATIFPHMRLPEVFGGHAREKNSPLPGVYNFANLLQAWSVSAISQFLQTILGIRPCADQNTLYLNPSLPDWLTQIEIRNVKVGGSELDISFEKEISGITSWRISRNNGGIRVVHGSESISKVG